MTVDELMDEFDKLGADDQSELAWRIWVSMKPTEEDPLWEEAEPEGEEFDADPRDVPQQLVVRARTARRAFVQRHRSDTE